MKLTSILGFGALAVAATIPFLGDTPVLANLKQAGQTVIETVKQPEVKLFLSAATKEVSLNKEGKEVISWSQLESGAAVEPGDTLRYTVDATNEGQLPASELEVVQPIPSGTVYELATAKSNSGAKITYSIDDGKTFVAQPTIKVKLETGEVVEKPAPADMYDFVKWNFGKDLEAAMAAKAMYEVKVPDLGELTENPVAAEETEEVVAE